MGKITRKKNFLSKIVLTVTKFMGEKVEKVIFMVICISFFAHVSSCLWYFLAAANDFGPDSWVVRTGYLDADVSQVNFHHFNLFHISSIFFL